ncbi:hypothetical protein AYI68_g4001 [Smittium mucronatum]|uniref:Uncharacterized protein n=1 Tax=Smittium mucronatum TaxID=133383 RepID=A0A1R0GYC1_9FUNG|nr:hypothetical protein AYI68_g4001 [Smittium mucronatum]
MLELVYLSIERENEKPVVYAWYYETGYEFSFSEQTLQYPLKLSSLGKREFIVKRGEFSIYSILKNPYMLMIGVSLAMIILVPKLQSMLDPEELEASNQMFAKPHTESVDFSATLAQMTTGTKPKQSIKK